MPVSLAQAVRLAPLRPSSENYYIPVQRATQIFIELGSYTTCDDCAAIDMASHERTKTFPNSASPCRALPLLSAG